MTKTRHLPHDKDAVDPGVRRLPTPQRHAASPNGMVVSAHYLATEAGVEILEDGGNAIDAAVATAMALGVCEPAASGIGGQSMLLIYEASSRRKIALDGSSRAPHRVTPGEYTQRQLFRGHQATTVPSTPAVMDYALKTFGTLPLSRVLEPAIRLAEQGYPVSQLQHDLTIREQEHLRAGTAAKMFLKEGKHVYRVGETFRQPILAETLRHLAKKGVEDFYHGEIAQAIFRDMAEHDGLIHEDDLAQIPWPIERRPLATWFRSNRIFTFGEPGAGRVLIEMLNVLDHFPSARWNPDTPEGALLLAEVIRRGQLDRHDRPYDPHFYWQVSGGRMTNTEYAEDVASEILEEIEEKRGETTHLSVMDRHGNVVGLTQSIERVYGSYCASPELGFIYNNYMSAFEYTDIKHPYYLRPNAVPWASVAPTMVFRGRKPWAVLGSPGSERIAPAVVQVLMRLETENPYEAVAAPRMHCSIKERVSLEAPRMRDDIPQFLEEHGYSIDRRDAFAFYLGCIALALKEQDEFIGVADPRRDGSAGGPHS